MKPIRSTLLLGISVAAVCCLTQCGDSDPEPVDCTTSGPAVTVNSVTDASCGQDNGEVDITVNGGASLEFSIAGSAFQSISAGNVIIENIPSGSQVITVRDANSCTATANFTVNNVNEVTIDVNTEDSGCTTSNGTLAVTANGGVAPYNYSLDGGALQSSNSFTDLPAGDYTVLVEDDEGCETSLTVSVLSGVSYTNEIQAIIDSNCALSGCHDGGNSLPDWSVLANVQANAENIKNRTSAMTMPPASSGITLEQGEIDAIACWVDDGALDN